MTVASNDSETYSVSLYASFSQPVVNAYLYNPPADSITMEYPYHRPDEIKELKSSLMLNGDGFSDGPFLLLYRIEGQNSTCYEDKIKVVIEDGRFEKFITLKEKHLEAKGIVWELSDDEDILTQGESPLSWAHFQGKVTYLDERWRSTYIDLFPVDFNAPGRITVPVEEGGSFDAFVPARIYAVMNVNGAGYSYDSMERWAWDYNLLNDRRDTFTIGRTELYGIHAFDVKSPCPTVFVAFRPTALSRVLQFDSDGDGLVQGEERKRMEFEMRDSPTVIGPELKAENVKVWLNDSEQEVVQFDKIPEYNGSIWQVQYLLQIYPNPRPKRGVWHEIKVEVESKESLRGDIEVDLVKGQSVFIVLEKQKT